MLPNAQIPGCLAPLGPLARIRASLPHPTALSPVPGEVWGERGGAGAKVCGLNRPRLEAGLPQGPWREADGQGWVGKGS